MQNNGSFASNDLTSNQASLSYIIPTLNRPTYLERCLDSINRQTLLPSEVIIVDQSDNESTKHLFERWVLRGSGTKKYIYQSEKGLTKARNNGLRNVGDFHFIGFLDDDLVLEPAFTERILRRFQQYGSERYAAGMGTIHGAAYKRNLLKKMFFLPHDGDGRILASGAPTFVHWKTEFSEVEFISGGMSIYRANILKKYGYDDRLVRYSYGDDVDVAYRISRDYVLFYEPAAVVYHNEEAPGRDPGIVHRKQMIQNMYYFLRKHQRASVQNKICFGWYVLGNIIDDAINGRRGAFLGNFAAIMNILKGTIDSVENYREFRRKTKTV